MATNGANGSDPHRLKLSAMLEELQHQYQTKGAFDPEQAAADVGHGGVWDILWRDPWLQAQLAAWLEEERQEARQLERTEELVAPLLHGDGEARQALVAFCLSVVTGKACTADKLRAAALAAELLGLRKHVPQPTRQTDPEGEQRTLELRELYEQYPELAAGQAIGYDGGENGQ